MRGKNLLYFSILAIPFGAFFVGMGMAFWNVPKTQNSPAIENVSYTIQFNYTKVSSLTTMSGLEIDSGFEFPHVEDAAFLGWSLNNDGSGTCYSGYHTLYEFYASITGQKTVSFYTAYSS